MAGDSALKLSIMFSALDKLSAPIERMRKGARGLATDMAKTRQSIKQLGDAQKLLGTFKLQDAGYKKQTAQLEEARAATAKFRAELAATDQPTIKMGKNLERAEKYEAVLTAQHEKQGAALTDLRAKLNAAGVDVGKLGDHEQRLAKQLGEANSALETQKARAAKMGAARAKGERLQAAGGKIAGAGAGVAVGIGAPTALLLRQSYNAAIESADALGQVTASMAGMGNAAQRTLPQLEAQAKKLQHISTFDDDDILRNVTTSMLTFDRVSGPLFDRAQAAAVNLSEKFHKDLQSSAIMVGKALQDPIKGLTALTRIGVSFTADQQELIKSLVATGHAAQAQAIIMGELERQTAGAGQAARDAKPGAAVTDQWRDFQEIVGRIAIKLLPPLTKALEGLLNAFNSLSPGTQTFVVGMMIAAVALGPLLGLLGGLLSIVGAVGAAFSIAFLPALAVVLAVVAVIALLGYAAYKIYEQWDPAKGFFENLWNGILSIFRGPVGMIMTLVSPVLGLPLLIMAHWEGIKTFFSGLWGTLVTGFKNAGSNMMIGLISALNPALLIARLLSVASAGLTAFKNFFGIKSPSRVFMGIGGHLTEGLAMGLDRGGKRPLRAMARLATGIGGAAVLGIASPGLAAGTGGSGAGPGAGAASSARSITYNVTINLTAGGDAKLDARAIKRELDALLAIDARGNYSDG